jgi:hypothetical protein
VYEWCFCLKFERILNLITNSNRISKRNGGKMFVSVFKGYKIKLINVSWCSLTSNFISKKEKDD